MLGTENTGFRTCGIVGDHGTGKSQDAEGCAGNGGAHDNDKATEHHDCMEGTAESATGIGHGRGRSRRCLSKGKGMGMGMSRVIYDEIAPT